MCKCRFVTFPKLTWVGLSNLRWRAMGWECVFFFPIPRRLFLELAPNYLITNSKVIFISNYFCEELIYLITNLRLFSKKKI
jgi:hypothetical protein